MRTSSKIGSRAEILRFAPIPPQPAAISRFNSIRFERWGSAYFLPIFKDRGEHSKRREILAPCPSRMTSTIWIGHPLHHRPIVLLDVASKAHQLQIRRLVCTTPRCGNDVINRVCCSDVNTAACARNHSYAIRDFCNNFRCCLRSRFNVSRSRSLSRPCIIGSTRSRGLYNRKKSFWQALRFTP